MIGNNPEDMADLAGKLGHAVDQIQQLTSSLDGKANSVQWQGPDADRFKHTDWPTYKTQLTKVAHSLQEVQQNVNKQRQQQIQTSAH
nr:WXG100 family type VII secretion target [Arthrobacter sp. SDTb3-6]